MIWEMTASIWSSWISIWDVLSPWVTHPPTRAVISGTDSFNAAALSISALAGV